MVPPVNDEVSASTWTATLRGFNEHPNTPPGRQWRRLTSPSSVCVCVCAIVLYTSVRSSANTSPLCARGSVKRERELFALTHRVYVCVSMLQRWMWAGVHMRFIVLLRVWETVSQHLSHTPPKSTARHRSPEIHRDLMWRDGYWAGSFCSCSLWFPINTRSLSLSLSFFIFLSVKP